MVEVKKEYEALRSEFELLLEFIKARKTAKLSQKALAKKLKLTQPAIARLESGGYTKTSISKLSKVVNALGFSLKVSFHAKKRN
jgi:predicted transcriptional regulator